MISGYEKFLAYLSDLIYIATLNKFYNYVYTQIICGRILFVYGNLIWIRHYAQLFHLI